MSEEERTQLNHMLEAVVEHAKLQGYGFRWTVTLEEAGVALHGELFVPLVWAVRFTVHGSTRNEVFSAVQAVISSTHRALGQFLGERT